MKKATTKAHQNQGEQTDRFFWQDEMDQVISPFEQNELSKIISIVRQQELFQLALFDGEIYCWEILKPFANSLSNKDYKVILPIDDSELLTENQKSPDCQNSLKRFKQVRSTKSPENVFEHVFFLACQRSRVAEFFKDIYDETSKLLIALAKNKTASRLILDEKFDFGEIAKKLTKSIVRRPKDPAYLKIGEMIYRQIICKMEVNNDNDFEYWKSHVINRMCRKDTAFSEEIKALTKDNKLPTDKTLSCWLQEYVNTLHANAPGTGKASSL